jgi:type I restriction enzyme S subunit
MSSNTKTTATKEEATPALGPKLRFPEFQNSVEWENKPLSTCLDYQQPTPYLVSGTNYSPAFKTPVLTAGKTFILGYTDEEHGIFSENLPVIIFDDFTTATQFVDFPFKAKSSAMKILQAKNGASIKFMFETLQTLSYEVGAHERHWISNFAPMSVPVPKPAEQQKIAECLSSVDELMAAQARKLDALKTHKKGLMQQLFPREGETQPRLRFPEFQNAGEWTEDALGNVCAVLNNRRRPITSTDRKPGPYRYYGASGVVDHVDDYIFDERVVLVGEDGAKWGAFERTAFIVEGRFWVNNHAHVLKPHGVSDALLENFLTMADLSPFVTGAAPPKLTLGKLKEIPVPIPPVKEEGKAIADCLTSLDDLIAAQTQKHEGLKTHKKGLMQQLFPSPEVAE